MTADMTAQMMSMLSQPENDSEHGACLNQTSHTFETSCCLLTNMDVQLPARLSIGQVQSMHICLIA